MAGRRRPCESRVTLCYAELVVVGDVGDRQRKVALVRAHRAVVAQRRLEGFHAEVLALNRRAVGVVGEIGRVVELELNALADLARVDLARGAAQRERAKIGDEVLDLGGVVVADAPSVGAVERVLQDLDDQMHDRRAGAGDVVAEDLHLANRRDASTVAAGARVSSSSAASSLGFSIWV